MTRFVLLFLTALALAALPANAIRTQLKDSIRVRAVASDSYSEESDFPLCPSADGDDAMECPKRNGVCCSLNGRPTGRCCARGEVCTSDSPPQCVAYAGMRHLDRLIEKMDHGLHRVNKLEIHEEKPKAEETVEDTKDTKDTNTNVRDHKIELVRMELESMKGGEGVYLTESEYQAVEKDLKTLEPPSLRKQEEDREAAAESELDRQEESEASKIAQKEAELERNEKAERDAEAERSNAAMSQRTAAQIREDEREVAVEAENARVVEEYEKRQAQKLAQQRPQTPPQQRPQTPPQQRASTVFAQQRPASANSQQPSRGVVINHINIARQKEEAQRLRKKIAELEEPLGLEIEPNPVAIHALNYLKARLKEIEEEGLVASDSHKDSARHFLRAVTSKTVTTTTSTNNPVQVNSNGMLVFDSINNPIKTGVITFNSPTTSSNDGCNNDDCYISASVSHRVGNLLPSGSLPASATANRFIKPNVPCTGPVC